MLLASKKHIRLFVSFHAPSGVTITPVVNNRQLEKSSKVIAQTLSIVLQFRLRSNKEKDREGFAEAYLLAQGWRVELTN